MPKPELAKFSRFSIALVVALGITGQTYADGSAVLASVTGTDQERHLKAKIAQDFGIEVRTTSVWVDEVNWTRLQSAVMPEEDARALVRRAQSKGYSAWYNSSGNRWATTREESSSAGTGRGTYRVSDSRDSEPVSYASDDNLGVVTPASGDISHLPMAETFPID